MLEFSKIEKKEQSKLEKLNFLKMNSLSEACRSIAKKLEAEYHRSVILWLDFLDQRGQPVWTATGAPHLANLLSGPLRIYEKYLKTV